MDLKGSYRDATGELVLPTDRPSNEQFARAKRGWLIECKVRGVPAWWNGMRFDLTDDKAWDFESTKVIVFADWASASTTLNNLRVETTKLSERRGPHATMERMQLAVTEHMWGPSDETKQHVLHICTAYESGFGRGLSGRELAQPYADGCDEAEAYVLGYQRAAAKVRGKTFVTLPEEPHVIKQIEHALDDCRDQIDKPVADYIRGCISDYRHALKTK